MKSHQPCSSQSVSKPNLSNSGVTTDTNESVDRHELADLGILLSFLQEQIQQRLASDLHDSTCQHLVAASLNLMRIRRAVGNNAKADRICDDIDASIEQALGELRAFSYLLYPQDLLADGLKATIERFVIGFSARTSLKVDLEISPEIDQLPRDAQRSLLSIIQEAFLNVFRHAKATRVTILAKANATHFLLRISDNGRGMPAALDRISLGIGIPSMRARLQQIGGVLQYDHSSATECRGTTLCATFPRSCRGRHQSRFTGISRKTPFRGSVLRRRDGAHKRHGMDAAQSCERSGDES